MTAYPKEWAFVPHQHPSNFRKKDLVPIEMIRPMGFEDTCPNCDGLQRVMAFRIGRNGCTSGPESDMHNRIKTYLFNGHEYCIYGEVIEEWCPLCHPLSRTANLLTRSGLLGLKLGIKAGKDITFDTILPKSFQHGAINALKAMQEPENLLLFGDNGVGKTMMLMALCNKFRETGTETHYVTAPQLLRRLRDTIGDDATETTKHVMAVYLNIPVLAIDELDKVNITSWSAEKLFDILDKRDLENRPTWTGSNMTPEQLRDMGIGMKAIVSRIGAGKLVGISGEDQRRVRLPDGTIQEVG